MGGWTGGPLYHGGVGGLKAGDYILPPNITNYQHSSLMMIQAGAATDPDGRVRGDRVYVTDRLGVATLFAAVRSGAVYLVEPEGQLELDPDAPGQSWMCPRARVVRVVRSSVRWPARKIMRKLAQLTLQ